VDCKSANDGSVLFDAVFIPGAEHGVATLCADANHEKQGIRKQFSKYGSLIRAIIK